MPRVHGIKPVPRRRRGGGRPHPAFATVSTPNEAVGNAPPGQTACADKANGANIRRSNIRPRSIESLIDLEFGSRSFSVSKISRKPVPKFVSYNGLAFGSSGIASPQSLPSLSSMAEEASPRDGVAATATDSRPTANGNAEASDGDKRREGRETLVAQPIDPHTIEKPQLVAAPRIPPPKNCPRRKKRPARDATSAEFRRLRKKRPGGSAGAAGEASELPQADGSTHVNGKGAAVDADGVADKGVARAGFPLGPNCPDMQDDKKWSFLPSVELRPVEGKREDEAPAPRRVTRSMGSPDDAHYEGTSNAVEASKWEKSLATDGEDCEDSNAEERGEKQDEVMEKENETVREKGNEAHTLEDAPHWSQRFSVAKSVAASYENRDEATKMNEEMSASADSVDIGEYDKSVEEMHVTTHVKAVTAKPPWRRMISRASKSMNGDRRPQGLPPGWSAQSLAAGLTHGTAGREYVPEDDLRSRNNERLVGMINEITSQEGGGGGSSYQNSSYDDEGRNRTSRKSSGGSSLHSGGSRSRRSADPIQWYPEKGFEGQSRRVSRGGRTGVSRDPAAASRASSKGSRPPPLPPSRSPGAASCSLYDPGSMSQECGGDDPGGRHYANGTNNHMGQAVPMHMGPPSMADIRFTCRRDRPSSPVYQSCQGSYRSDTNGSTIHSPSPGAARSAPPPHILEEALSRYSGVESRESWYTEAMSRGGPETGDFSYCSTVGVSRTSRNSKPMPTKEVVNNKRAMECCNFRRCITVCVPNASIKTDDHNAKQAWREKVAICLCVFLASGFFVGRFGLVPLLLTSSLIKIHGRMTLGTYVHKILKIFHNSVWGGSIGN